MPHTGIGHSWAERAQRSLPVRLLVAEWKQIVSAERRIRGPPTFKPHNDAHLHDDQGFAVALSRFDLFAQGKSRLTARCIVATTARTVASLDACTADPLSRGLAHSREDIGLGPRAGAGSVLMLWG